VYVGLCGESFTVSNDFFRFSTTEFKWEQLDAQLVLGSPVSRGVTTTRCDMVAVGTDIYVFADVD